MRVKSMFIFIYEESVFYILFSEWQMYIDIDHLNSLGGGLQSGEKHSNI